MKSFWKSFWIMCVASALGGAVTIGIACGPEKKFCPEQDGPCPDPRPDAASQGESIFVDDSGSIFIEVGTGTVD